MNNLVFERRRDSLARGLVHENIPSVIVRLTWQCHYRSHCWLVAIKLKACCFITNLFKYSFVVRMTCVEILPMEIYPSFLVDKKSNLRGADDRTWALPERVERERNSSNSTVDRDAWCLSYQLVSDESQHQLQDDLTATQRSLKWMELPRSLKRQSRRVQQRIGAWQIRRSGFEGFVSAFPCQSIKTMTHMSLCLLINRLK